MGSIKPNHLECSGIEGNRQPIVVGFGGQAKGLIEKFSVLKHGFFPGSVTLNAHWSLLFVCLFLFNSNVQITMCCTSLESLNLLPPRNKARCWQSDSVPFLINLPKVVLLGYGH